MHLYNWQSLVLSISPNIVGLTSDIIFNAQNTSVQGLLHNWLMNSGSPTCLILSMPSCIQKPILTMTNLAPHAPTSLGIYLFSTPHLLHFMPQATYVVRKACSKSISEPVQTGGMKDHIRTVYLLSLIWTVQVFREWMLHASYVFLPFHSKAISTLMLSYAGLTMLTMPPIAILGCG